MSHFEGVPYGMAHAVRDLRTWEDQNYRDLFSISINLDIVVLIFCCLDDGADRISIKSFVARLAWAERTIFSHLRSLEKGGWLIRTKGNPHDRRFTDVTPTDKLLRAFQEWQEQILLNFERAYQVKVDSSRVKSYLPSSD